MANAQRESRSSQTTFRRKQNQGNCSLWKGSNQPQRPSRTNEINLLGDASINGESLNNIKASKEWKRSGEHGRATEVGDIAVERIKDANGNAVEGKYKMTAVIDGNVFPMRLPKAV